MEERKLHEDDTYVIHGPEPLVPLSKDTIGKEIYKSLMNIPEDSVAMIDAFTRERLLHRDFFQTTVNLAVALRHWGYTGQSTVLAISSENCLEFFVPVFASFFNGSIMAPMNHTYTSYELEHTMNISEPKVIFCSEETAHKFVDLKRKLHYVEKIIVLNSDHNTAKHISRQEGLQTMDQFIRTTLKGENVDLKTFQPVDGDISKMVALIMCSSGTTGLPKGVALSHRNLQIRLAHSRDSRIFPDRSTSLGMIPFFHGYGLLVTFTCLCDGQTVICLKKFDEDVFLRSIEEYQVTTLSLAPPLAIFLAKSKKVDKYNLSSVEQMYCGAAPLSKSIEDEVKRRLKCDNMRQGYGLTETTMAVTVVPSNDLRSGSCGKVVAFGSGKVRDPETGRSLGPNQVGELCWKGPVVMMGYYKNEEATKNTFTPDGWLKSGDLGYYDEDGYFYVIDRLKELIKYKGYQVAPAELEAILVNHPKIDDAGVVGLPDELVGERPLAFVVKKNDVTLSEEEVKKYVAELVSPQKRLSGGVIFVQSIPKNPSGKILRKELRELLKQYNKKMVPSKL